MSKDKDESIPPKLPNSKRHLNPALVQKPVEPLNHRYSLLSPAERELLMTLATRSKQGKPLSLGQQTIFRTLSKKMQREVMLRARTKSRELSQDVIDLQFHPSIPPAKIAAILNALAIFYVSCGGDALSVEMVGEDQ